MSVARVTAAVSAVSVVSVLSIKQCSHESGKRSVHHLYYVAINKVSAVVGQCQDLLNFEFVDLARGLQVVNTKYKI